MHYKTIKFSIKKPLNIQHFHFCGATCAQFDIANLRRFFVCCHFSTFAPPPPNPKNGSTPLGTENVCVCVGGGGVPPPP